MIHNWKDSCVGLALILWMILVGVILDRLGSLVENLPYNSQMCAEHDFTADVERFKSSFRVGFLPDTLNPTPQIETTNTYIDGACNQGLHFSYAMKNDPVLIGLRLEFYPLFAPTTTNSAHGIHFGACKKYLLNKVPGLHSVRGN